MGWFARKTTRFKPWPLWSNFCYSFLLFPPSFSLFLNFWALVFLNLFPILFQAFHWWKHFPTFILLKKTEEQSVQITACFTLGMEQHHPRQWSRKYCSHQMHENFSKHRETRVFTSAVHAYAQQWMLSWKLVPKIFFSWELEILEWTYAGFSCCL